MANYNPHQVEKEVLSYWEKQETYKKAKKGKKKFYFLDGPPYTSGHIHLGTAWNKALKDSVLRFKRMQGYDVFDRAGYDMHGLPVAKKVEAKLNLSSKEDIKRYGLDKFITECKNFALKNMEAMSDEFKRLGVWMDFDNAYKPITREYIQSVWWLIKQAHNNKRLYEGEKTMTWCKNCSTALAKHELEYKTVTDNSIFVKFQVAGKDNEFLVIWTTTPWTIPFNMGIMVHPDLDYVKIKVENEYWYVAKGLVHAFMNTVVEKPFEIVETFKGKKLKGMKYIHPMKDEIEFFKKNKNKKVHSVVLSSKYVDLSAGTGLVHMAPGCGPEDYEVGHREGIPPFNNLNDEGVFPESMGKFSGWIAKDDDKKFIEDLKQRGVLIAITPVEHEYAHCWRCKKPVIFKTTKQWFFKVEDLKEEMRELNKKIKWVPEWAGSNWFDSWLQDLRDNSITRQRFWGTPIPIWKCDKCGKVEVIGSVDELKQKAGEIPEDLHIPWIDKVQWKCQCGGTFKRIPDILDVWIDSGTSSWAALDYPAKKDLFKKLYPADFILEGKDQIRGWFNLLFVTSMVAMRRPPFKAVYMHGFINDAKGRKMSKSLGNVIKPYEVIDKYGADTLRYYSIGAANAGLDMNYNFDDINVKYRNLTILWNLHNYLIEYRDFLGKGEKGIEENYIISRLNSTINEVTELFEQYKIYRVPEKIETLFLDLSRTYVQLTREKIKSNGMVVSTILEVLLGALKLFAPIAPFITEKIYLNLKKEFKLKEESIHHFSWPNADNKLIDKELEKKMEVTMDIIQGVMNAREKARLGVRWPIPKAIILCNDEFLPEIIERQANIRKILRKRDFKVEYEVKPVYKNLGRKYKDKMEDAIKALKSIDAESFLKKGKARVNGFVFESGDAEIKEIPPQHWHYSQTRYASVYVNDELDDELKKEGFARELMRRIQSMRKKNGLKKEHRIKLAIKSDINLQEWKEAIAEKCGVVDLNFEEMDFEHTEDFIIADKKFRVSFQKI